MTYAVYDLDIAWSSPGDLVKSCYFFPRSMNAAYNSMCFLYTVI